MLINKDNTIVVVQVRADSSRLPNKWDLPIKSDSETTLMVLIDRLLPMMREGYNVYIATTERECDDAIIDKINKVCCTKKYHYLKTFRGDLNILTRFDKLLDTMPSIDYMVRITADDILVDSNLILYNIDLLNKYNTEKINITEYFYTKNIIRGFDFEIIKTNIIKEMALLEMKPEHIEYYIKQNYICGELEYSDDIRSHTTGISLTIDNIKDYDLVSDIAYQLYYDDNTCDINTSSMQEIMYIINKSKILTTWNRENPVGIYCAWNNDNGNYGIDKLFNALDSVINQTFKRYDFYLIIYGSKSNSSELLDVINYCFKNGIKLFYNESNNFIDIVKYATNLIKNKYIMRLDADDVMYVNAIDIMYNQLVLESNCVVAYTGYHEKNEIKDRCRVVTCYDNNLPCHALIDRKILAQAQYLDGQTCRDGTVLDSIIKKNNYKTCKCNIVGFIHFIREGTITNNLDVCDKTDTYIMEYYGVN